MWEQKGLLGQREGGSPGQDGHSQEGEKRLEPRALGRGPANPRLWGAALWLGLLWTWPWSRPPASGCQQRGSCWLCKPRVSHLWGEPDFRGRRTPSPLELLPTRSPIPSPPPTRTPTHPWALAGRRRLPEASASLLALGTHLCAWPSPAARGFSPHGNRAGGVTVAVLLLCALSEPEIPGPCSHCLCRPCRHAKPGRAALQAMRPAHGDTLSTPDPGCSPVSTVSEWGRNKRSPHSRCRGGRRQRAKEGSLSQPDLRPWRPVVDNRSACRALPACSPGPAALSGAAWSPPSALRPRSPAHSHQASREVRWSGVVGSGLRGGEVTNAAALAQFLLQ